jgi:hypothetical protein
MPPPDHLHEAIQVLCTRIALQPRVRDLLAVLASLTFTWLIVPLTCRKLNSDSSLVNSASMVTMWNFPEASSIYSMG